MDVCRTDSSEKGENQPLIAKMNRSICTNNGKSFGFWLRFPSFPTRYIGKMIFFFLVLWQLNKAIQYVWQTASRWNKYATTFPLQERAKTYLCSYKRFVLFYRHDLYCQIMILPYSHSLSVQSVARNGYGYIRTMQRWNSCGLWQKPLNCLQEILRKGGMCYCWYCKNNSKEK